MHIYCMRHGQTNYNVASLCNADPAVDVHLTPEGIRQAEAAAEQLRDCKLELIITSPLPRTQQTAAIINRHHQVDIVVHEAIIDIRTGCEDQSVAAYYQSIAADPLHTRPLGGESLLDHRARVLEFAQWLRKQQYNTVLVIAHEETLRVLYALEKALPEERMPDLFFRNCEIFSITL